MILNYCQPLLQALQSLHSAVVGGSINNRITVPSPSRRDAAFTLNLRQEGPVVIFYIKKLLQNKITLIK